MCPNIRYTLYRMALIGKAAECALHCLVYLVDKPDDVTMGVANLAEFQGISETYLAKIFAKLNHAGIVKASRGLKGGYELAMNPEDISFWAVVSALDKKFAVFHCHNVRGSCVLLPKAGTSKNLKMEMCTIHRAMLDSEDALVKSLKQKKLKWLYLELKRKIPQADYKKGYEWFVKKSDERLHSH